MKTLKEIKTDSYNNMKDRYNDFLEEEERYIIENLKSDPNISGSQSKYNEAEVFDIACESLEGDTKTDKEELNWEAGYARGYEVALEELLSYKEDTIHKDQIKYLLNN